MNSGGMLPRFNCSPPDCPKVRICFSGVVKKKALMYNDFVVCKLQNHIQGGMVMSKYTDDLHSLSHTKWNYKYRIVFAPKYMRKELLL